MYKVNNSGPKILPWGTPDTTGSNPENCWLIFGEVVFRGIRNSGITELRNKQIYTLTLFHYRRLY